MGKPPLGSCNGEAVEGKAHGLPDAHEAIDGSHFGQHMGRVSSLALSLLEPALFFKDSYHGIQQHLLCSPFKQTLAKVGQNGKVKAGIGQF